MSSLNKNCKKCPLHETADTVCMKGKGPKDAQLVIVNEWPNAIEDRQGRPLLGDAGKILQRELEKQDILEDAYITHVVKCKPPKGRAPTTEEINACKPYLEKRASKDRS